MIFAHISSYPGAETHPASIRESVEGSEATSPEARTNRDGVEVPAVRVLHHGGRGVATTRRLGKINRHRWKRDNADRHCRTFAKGCLFSTSPVLVLTIHRESGVM